VRCYVRSRARLARIVDRIVRRVRSLPLPLRRLGSAWRKSLGRDGRHYFSSPDSPPLLQLPIWLAEGSRHAGRITARQVDAILEATALLYFHTRIQDNVLDEPGGRGQPPQLLLANVFALEGWRLLHDLPLSRSFWAQAGEAWRVFSAETADEQTQLRSRRPYSRARFRRHARKVALARIPLHAVHDLLGTPRPRHIAELVDGLGEAYGLANDVLGVTRDLTAGLRTYLIAAVEGSRPGRATPASLRRALLEQSHLESFLDRALVLHRRLLPLGQALGIAGMAEFTTDRLLRLRHHQAQVLGLRLSYACSRKP
jgi:hypothetical protein